MRYFFLSITLFISLNCFSQQIKVIDAESNTALNEVLIVSLRNNFLVSTDSNGIADIGPLKEEGSLKVQLFGYSSFYTTYAELTALNDPIKLRPVPFRFGKEIVISASRWKQSQKHMPHKISSITKKDFRIQNSQTTADLLASSGDVFIQKSQQGGGSPMIRGFATNRLLYSVDGTRMNTAIFRSGNLQNVISMDPFATENVEIFFGPGSILFGSDAIGGVMSFETKSPELIKEGKIKVNGNASLRTASANSEITSHLDLSIATKRFGFLSSFSRSDFGDLIMGANGPDEYLRDSLVIRQNESDIIVSNDDSQTQVPTNYEQNNFMQKILYEARSGLEFLYAFHYSETSHYDRYDRLSQEINGRLRFAENEYGPQKWIMHQLQIKQENKSNWFDKAKYNFAYQRFQESRIDRMLNDSIRRRRLEEVDAFSVNLDFTKKINQRHSLFYGLEGVYNSVNSSGTAFNLINKSSESIQSRYPDSDWFSNALYISHQFSLHEDLQIESGIRFNQYALDSKFDTSFISLPFDEISFNNLSVNGSLGLSYLPNDKLSLSTKVSTGFRSPNVDDIGKFFDPEPFSVVVPNKQLKAETAYNLDLSISKIWSNFLKTNITFFYTFLDNALVRRDFTLNDSDSLFFDGENKKVQAIQNAAKATIYGMQLSTEMKISKNLNWVNQLSFQDGEEELRDGSHTAARHVAPLFANSRLDYTKDKFRIQFSLFYSDEIAFSNLNLSEQAKPHLYAIDNNGNPYSPSWYTLNLKAQFFATKAITLNWGLENISNQRYRTYSSGIAAAGRNVTFAIIADF